MTIQDTDTATSSPLEQLQGLMVVGTLRDLTVRGRSETFEGFYTALIESNRGTDRVDVRRELRTPAGNIPLGAFDVLTRSDARGARVAVSVGTERGTYTDKNGIERRTSSLIAIDAVQL